MLNGYCIWLNETFLMLWCFCAIVWSPAVTGLASIHGSLYTAGCWCAYTLFHIHGRRKVIFRYVSTVHNCIEHTCGHFNTLPSCFWMLEETRASGVIPCWPPLRVRTHHLLAVKWQCYPLNHSLSVWNRKAQHSPKYTIYTTLSCPTIKLLAAVGSLSKALHPQKHRLYSPCYFITLDKCFSCQKQSKRS